MNNKLLVSTQSFDFRTRFWSHCQPCPPKWILFARMLKIFPWLGHNLPAFGNDPTQFPIPVTKQCPKIETTSGQRAIDIAHTLHSAVPTEYKRMVLNIINLQPPKKVLPVFIVSKCQIVFFKHYDSCGSQANSCRDNKKWIVVTIRRLHCWKASKMWWLSWVIHLWIFNVKGQQHLKKCPECSRFTDPFLIGGMDS